MKCFLRIFLFLGFFSGFMHFAQAFAKEQPQESPPEAFKSTPYPVPRFVSLHASEVYARTGPGMRYPIKMGL